MNFYLFVVLPIVLTMACVSAPSTIQPKLAVSVPELWTSSATPSGVIDPEWWSDFNDPGLDASVRTALDRNYDLHAAAARLELAAANSRIAGADLKPSVQLGFNSSRRKQNFIGLPIPGREGFVLSTISTNLGVSLDVSWEVDLWGRLRAGSRAALADLQSAAADLRGAQLSIAGQTAKAYFAVAEASQQVALAAATVISFRTSSEQVRDRFERGLRPSLDVRLALANQARAEALLQERSQQLDVTTRQLEVLLGSYAGKTLEVPTTFPDTPAPVSAGLPSDLVARRPDLVAAERRLAAETQRVSLARGDLYPRLSLTNSGGRSSNVLRSLIDGDFSVWGLASSVLQPIFEGGRLRAQVDGAEARTDEALANYASAVLQAYAEVESALSAEAFLTERVDHLTQGSEQSRAAEILAESRYRNGLESYVTVLEAQRRALDAQGSLIAARRLRLENRVDLYLALGGGFDQLEAPVQLQLSETLSTSRN